MFSLMRLTQVVTCVFCIGNIDYLLLLWRCLLSRWCGIRRIWTVWRLRWRWALCWWSHCDLCLTNNFRAISTKIPKKIFTQIDSVTHIASWWHMQTAHIQLNLFNKWAREKMACQQNIYKKKLNYQWISTIQILFLLVCCFFFSLNEILNDKMAGYSRSKNVRLVVFMYYNFFVCMHIGFMSSTKEKKLYWFII